MKTSVTMNAALLLIACAAAAGPASRPDWTASTTVWDSGAYVYDGTGNIMAIGADNYAYDVVNRLAYATAKTPSFSNNEQRFTYDRYGNLKTVTTISGTTTLRAGFRLDPSTNQLNAHGVCPAPVDTCFTGEYDQAGNQMGVVPGDGYYQWDALDVMTGVDLPTRHDHYLYDANDERIATINVNDGSRLYTLRDGSDKVVREIASAGTQWTWEKDYVYRGSALTAAFAAGESGSGPHLHFHIDHLGTPRLITDSAGYKKSIHTYWPFGAEAPGSDLDAERLKFTGHERDSSGPDAVGQDLDYMHARYYGAMMGRFLSVDPVIDAKAALRVPQSWNRYAYVQNEPLRYIDPDGRQTEDADGSDPDDSHHGIFGSSGLANVRRIDRVFMAALDKINDAALNYLATVATLDIPLPFMRGRTAVLLGENMGRVGPLAEQLKLATFRGTGRTTTETLAMNLKWLAGQMKKGASILDIGLDASRGGTSGAFYKAEVQLLQKAGWKREFVRFAKMNGKTYRMYRWMPPAL